MYQCCLPLPLPLPLPLLLLLPLPLLALDPSLSHSLILSFSLSLSPLLQAGLFIDKGVKTTNASKADPREYLCLDNNAR